MFLYRFCDTSILLIFCDSRRFRRSSLIGAFYAIKSMRRVLYRNESFGFVRKRMVVLSNVR